MTRFEVPVPEAAGSRIMLLGAGGGFDVLCTLPVAADAKPFRDEVLTTDDVESVREAIERTRQRLGTRRRSDIPI